MCSERQCSEQTLIAQAQQGSERAMEALLMAHRPLLHALANRMLCDRCIREELIQAGNIGLIEAVQRYDSNQGVKLVTYAVPWILGEMKRTMQKEDHPCVSLEEPCANTQLSLGEVLQGETGVDIERLALRLALKRLPRQEQMLICLRYYRDKTQKETALLLHKSQTQISRMERHALDCLHAWLA